MLHLVITTAVICVLIASGATAQVLTPDSGVLANGVAYTFTISGPASSGDTYLFLKTGLTGYTCPSPPSVAIVGGRSAVSTADATSVEIDLAPLTGDEYTVCRRPVTSASAGFRGYAALAATVTLVPVAPTCPGATICKTVPSTLYNGASGPQSVRFVGMPAGTQVLLSNMFVNGQKVYDCLQLPPAALLQTTGPSINGALPPSFDVNGLTPGEYTVCQRPVAGDWGELPLTVTVSGPIATLHSSLCCSDGPFVVGERVFCQIHARDALDNLAGAEADACDFAIFMLTDGVGATLSSASYVPPYFLDTGLFEFSFTPTKSGIKASAGVAYGGAPVGKKIQLLTLAPREPQEAMFTSSCATVGAQVACNVTKRDEYSNPIASCDILSDGTVVCA